MSKTKKIIIWVVGVLVIGYVVLYGLGYGLMKYDQYKMSKIPENFAKFEEEQRQIAMADTYGGKTPEETLDMFIKAVQAGDYDLASKYFVIPRQEMWKERLNKIGDTQDFLVKLNNVLDTIQTKKITWDGKERFVINDPFYIAFLLYPNGIWKINEI